MNEVGRYLRVDPLSVGGSSMDDASYYAYAANNPVNGIDHTGCNYLLYIGVRYGKMMYGPLIVCSDAGTTIFSAPAMSGSRKYRAIADGTYPVNPPRKPYTCGCFRDGGDGGCCVDPTDCPSCWFAEIHNTPGRSGLGIHPDGNEPGTQGCIGVDTAYAGIMRGYLSEGMTLYVKTLRDANWLLKKLDEDLCELGGVKE